MKKKNIYFLLFMLSITLFSCHYDYIAEEVVTPPDPNTEVKFSTDVLPIFTTANCVSCHKTGGTSPDLTAANAYSQLTSKNMINTTTPASSKIYSYIEPGTATHSWKKYTATQAQVILTWIERGAKND